MRNLIFAALLLLLPAVALAQPGPSSPRAIPSGANTSLSLAAVASQQGVLLDAFKVAGDADDTASMTRAVAAGVPILCGPKTYTVNNFSTGAVASFVLRGVPGCVIQRTSASGSNFFTIGATNVSIDGVTFDSNKASVTANQWGVLLSQGGQTVTVRNSAFKNNSGTLGSCFALLSTGPAAGGSFVFADSEVTGCASNGTYFGSVSSGVIKGNYIHDNTAWGMFAGSFTAATGTNYLRDVVITGNRFYRNAFGLQVGGIGPPYIYGTPAATHVTVEANAFQDNSTNLTMQGDYLTAIGNIIDQSAPGVAVNTGIDANARYTLVQGNSVVLAGSSFGIDTGSAVEAVVSNNYVAVTSGTALNSGGSINSVVQNNKLNISGTAYAMTVYETDTDGNLVPFPQHNSGLLIEANNIIMSGASTNGIGIFDDAGGFSGSTPTIIRNNRFVGTNSAGSTQAITYFATGAAVQIQGNQWNGTGTLFLNPNGSNDLIVPDVFDTISTFAGSSGIIRSVNTASLNTYNAGGSILYVLPTAGGTGYVPATTTLAATVCSGWTGTPLISQGVIVGVRTTAHGTGCSGATAVTATDSGGGSGATFAVTRLPTNLTGRQIQVTASVTTLLQSSGGATSLSPTFPMILATNTPANLVGNGGTAWQASQPMLPAFAIGSLPTCNAATNGAPINVTGSVSGKWQARCNATNWIAPDGTTIN